QYVGSFAVEDLDLQQQAGRLEEQLRALKDCPRRRSVVLRFSLQGLKVYGADGEVGVLGRGGACPKPPHPHPPKKIPLLLLFLIFAGSFFCLPQVQTLHLLLCRSFQLGYLLAHPEEQA
ncbi:SH2D5 protein, partial [Uria aalge]|nr:SH2D5 protein [Uria aalge]